MPPRQTPFPLSDARKGWTGVVVEVGGRRLNETPATDADARELERRLLEIGFVEGARLEVLHEGLFGRDPLAIKVEDMRVAIRRKEAGAILVRSLADDSEAAA